MGPEMPSQPSDNEKGPKAEGEEGEDGEIQDNTMDVEEPKPNASPLILDDEKREKNNKKRAIVKHDKSEANNTNDNSLGVARSTLFRYFKIKFTSQSSDKGISAMGIGLRLTC
jgi:hypothetical protein